jgi:hypothetical protein
MTWLPRLVLLTVIPASLAPAADAAAQASRLLSGKTFSGQAVEGSGPRRGRAWPFEIRFGGTAGAVTGELTWPTLNSVHRVSGALSGQTLRFTEVSAIRAGSAHLRCSYTLTLSGNRASGTYVDPNDGSSGTASIDLGGDSVTPPAPAAAKCTTPPAPAPILKILGTTCNADVGCTGLLSWTGSSGAETYRVSWYSPGSSSWAEPVVVPGSTQNWRFKGAMLGTRYVVRPHNTCGNGPESNEAFVRR